MKRIFLALIAAVTLTCQANTGLTVSVKGSAMHQAVEMSADSVLNLLGSKYCYVADSKGREIPSQITHDGLLIFQPEVSSYNARYRILPSRTPRSYAKLTSGRPYPERADDIAWENELVGFRIYGPGTQKKNERAYGYDIFFKHHTPEQILEKLYAPETSAATWVIVDSLRAISDQKAEDYIKTFSYHIDHGLGMDCYAVGPTLGAGATAPLVNDSISYSWCYDKAEVLDNGPLRFTVLLTFAPRPVGADSAVIEHRLISLDAGSHLNHARVWYEGMTAPVEIVTGFPLRDSSAPVSSDTVIAYADPTQGPDNGKALLGVVSSTPFTSTEIREKHILGHSIVNPGEVYDYYWGFVWSREPIDGKKADMKSWTAYLNAFSSALHNPPKIRIKK